MKTRQSGMPEESMWEQFFSPSTVLAKLGLAADGGDVVDFGCGYGTFTIPAARMVRGTVYAFDVDPELIATTMNKARAAGLTNIRAERRDFVAGGTGLPDASVGYVMLFNILHCEDPLVLLREAWRILRKGGRVGIIHWNYDAATPRGPSMDIRPRPDQCRTWAVGVGFELEGPLLIDLPPHHYGMVLCR